ncbi:hypothetical protein ABBQ38_001808 [Trebouxia sp. C0009 RCD-2024]
MFCARLFVTRTITTGRRLSLFRAYRQPVTIALDDGLRSITPGGRQHRQTLAPTAIFHSYKLHTTWLQAGTPTFSTAGNLQFQSKSTSQFDKRPPQSPDISMLSPELQKQWHVDRNMHLGTIKVKPHSKIPTVWNHCPVGQPHVWIATVQSRTRGTKCPYCSKKQICLHNSLATIAPDVAQYWNHSKNVKSPDQVLAGSSFPAEWRCPACKYEWQTPIGRRVREGSGCPQCSLASRVMHSHPTFAEAQPAELAQWDHKRNEAEGFYPHLVTLGSCKQVHWICSCCPKGQPHRWTAPPYNRVRNGRGCAVCSGRQACACNALESSFPSLAAEFDTDKNGFAPSEVTAGSDKEVWWRNAKRGSWRQAVHVRTARRIPLSAEKV